MAFISKIKLPNDDTTYDIKSKTTQGILYGEVASTSTASAFTATISDLNIAAYYDGLTVMLKNGVVNAGSTFTLNINSLGAKEVKTNSVSANGNSLFVNGSTMIFVYSSTAATNGAWYCYHGIDNVSGMYYVAGSGSTAAKTSSPYYASRWRGNNPSITTLYSGLCIYYKIDVAGNGTYGTVLSINGGAEHPVVANVNSMVSTRYAVNCIIPLVYDANQTATAYINGTAATTLTGCWKIADYDSNTITQTAARDFKVSPTAGTLYRYQICLVAEDDGLVPYNNVNNATGNYTKALNSTPFDPFKGMFWYGTTAAISPGQGVSIGGNTTYIVYQQDVRYSFNINSGVSSSQVAATNGATVYNTSYKYAVGAYCTYLGELYKCKTAITTAGAWNASQWTKITQYSASSTYAVNTECLHEGYLYKCTTAISQAEAWNPAHWTLSTLTGLISQEPVYIKAKYNTTTRTATLVGNTSSPSYLVRSGLAQGLPESNPNTGLAANEFYIYIFIGQAYTCYNVGMFAMHPIFYWNEKAGKATVFTGVEDALPSVSSTDNGKLLTVVNGEWAPATKPSYTANEVGALPSNTTYVSTVNGQSGAVTVAIPGTLNTTATSAQTTSSSESLSGSVTLHKVAKTGTYSDLIGTPAIPHAPGTLNTNNDAAQAIPIAAEALSGTINLHKIAKTGTYSDLIGKPTIPSAPGTLDTTATTAQSTSSSEALSGNITLHKVAKTGSYNDLLNKPTIPTVNNATLTIQKNGSTVNTFTANASSNVTANITVPTKTSDLTNDGDDGTHSFLATDDVIPLANGGTGLAVNDANWYSGNTLHPRFEVLFDIDDGGFYVQYRGPLDGISDISDFISSDYFKAAVRSLVPMWVGGIGVMFFGTAMVMTGLLAESDINKIYILFPDAILYYGQYVNGLKGTLVYDENDGVYMLPNSMQPLTPGWTALLDSISSIYPISYDNDNHEISHNAILGNSLSLGLYKISADEFGHVTGSSAVQKSDITGLGIPGSDTNTTYSLAVNGTGDNVNKLGLTAGGSGSGTVWVTVPYAATAGSAPSEFVFTDFTVGA